MENQNQNNQINEINKPKGKFWKFTLIFFTIIAGVFVLYIASSWCWYFFRQWQGEKAVEELAGRLERIKQEDYQKAMADTYGGRIPQETLQMYISAVETGNYELASKYFIEKYQEKELEKLNKVTKEFIDKYLSLLKKSTNGYFSSDDIPGRKEFFIDEPIYIRIGLYPNNIWKIIEI